MDLTAVTLTELRYVVAVADTGHFGRAAFRCIGLVWRRSFPDAAGIRTLAAFVRARAPKAVRAIAAADREAVA